MSCLNALLLFGAIAIGADPPADFALPPPPGKYAVAGPETAASPTFRSKSPLVATSYFYWYDAASKAHVLNGDGTDALPDQNEGMPMRAKRGKSLELKGRFWPDGAPNTTAQ